MSHFCWNSVMDLDFMEETSESGGSGTCRKNKIIFKKRKWNNKTASYRQAHTLLEGKRWWLVLIWLKIGKQSTVFLLLFAVFFFFFTQASLIAIRTVEWLLDLKEILQLVYITLQQTWSRCWVVIMVHEALSLCSFFDLSTLFTL